MPQPTSQLETEYASPKTVRVASPASTIGSTFARDQTSFSDSEFSISQSQFEKKWEGKIGLRDPRTEEKALEHGPLLGPLPVAASNEERGTLFDSDPFLGEHAYLKLEFYSAT